MLAGHHMVSPAAAKQSYREQQYGGVLGTVMAGALGLARGLTFGISDELASMGGAEKLIAGSPLTDEDTMRFLKERYEVASGLGVAIGLGLMWVLSFGLVGGGARASSHNADTPKPPAGSVTTSVPAPAPLRAKNGAQRTRVRWGWIAATTA